MDVDERFTLGDFEERVRPILRGLESLALALLEFQDKIDEITGTLSYIIEAANWNELNLDRLFFDHTKESLSDLHGKCIIWESKACNLFDFFSRKEKKIPFFGDVSNGKSAVLNAVLGSTLLPSTSGHTTDSLLLLSGENQCNNYTVKQGEDVQHFHDTESLKRHLKEVGGEGVEREDGHVPVFHVRIPVKFHPCIGINTTLIDCPGANNNKAFDGAIKEHCQDADVLVMVLDSTRNLSDSEKEFLKNVAKYVAVPHIIFAINKWDKVKENKEAQKKQVWMGNLEKFLRKELRTELNQDNCHFITAKLALEAKHQGLENQHRNSFGNFEEALQRVICQRRTELAAGHVQAAINLFIDVIQGINGLIDDIHIFGKYHECKIAKTQFNEFWAETPSIVHKSCEQFEMKTNRKLTDAKVTIRDLIIAKVKAGRERPTEAFAKTLQSYIENNLKERIRTGIIADAEEEIENIRHKFLDLMATDLGDVETKMRTAALAKPYKLRNQFELPEFVREYQGKTVSSWIGPTIEKASSVLVKFCNTCTAFMSLIPVGWTGFQGFAIRGGVAVAGVAAGFAGDISRQHDESVMNEMIHEFTQETNQTINEGLEEVVQPPKHDLEQQLMEMYEDFLQSRKTLLEDFRNDVLGKEKMKEEELIALRARVNDNLDNVIDVDLT